jgi:hypothetical protein
MKLRLFINWIIILALLLPAMPVSAQDEVGWLQPYVMPGEHLVTLENGLSYQGQLYKIHYLTADANYNNTASSFIGFADKATFERNRVNAVLVTTGQQIISDPDLLSEILLAYRAAHYLYWDVASSNPYFGGPDSMAQEMENFSKLPLPDNIRSSLQNVIGARQFEYAEALRGIVSSQLAPPDTIKQASQEAADNLKTADSFAQAADTTAKVLQHDKATRSVMNRMINIYTPVVRQGDKYSIFYQGSTTRLDLYNAADMIDLMVRMIWVADLQHERYGLVQTYLEKGGGAGQMSNDMRLAADTTGIEVDNEWNQRGNILFKFVADAGFKLAEKAAAKAVQTWFYEYGVKLAAEKSAGRVFLYGLGNLMGAANLGYVIGDLLFGVSGANANFIIGVRTFDYVKNFRAWRETLHNQYYGKKVENFDAEIALQYRAAYLLEAYSSARTITYYTDGVDKTLATGVIDWISKIFTGQDRKTAAEGLRKIAVEVETKAVETLGAPSFISEAVRLSANRLQLRRLTVDDSDPGFALLSGAPAQQLSGGFQNSATWTENMQDGPQVAGKWQASLDGPGQYVVMAYIPEDIAQTGKPYPASVEYTIRHNNVSSSAARSPAQNAGTWLNLGTYEFTGGPDEFVGLSSSTLEAPGSSAIVFDAVRFIPAEQAKELVPDAGIDWNPFDGASEGISNWFKSWLQDLQKQFAAWVEEVKQQMTKELQKQIEAWFQQLLQQISRWLQETLMAMLKQNCATALLPALPLALVWSQKRRRK